jgi:hypothetical protein
MHVVLAYIGQEERAFGVGLHWTECEMLVMLAYIGQNVRACGVLACIEQVIKACGVGVIWAMT